MQHLKSKLTFKDDSDFSVTYKLNKVNGIFNWYPYTEGFSKPFVDKMLHHFGAKKGDLILDPFSGCGTTALSCTIQNINSLSIEVNPFMDFVGRAKNNSLKLDIHNLKDYFQKILDAIKKNQDVIIPSFLKDKPFFHIDNLKQALIIKQAIIKNVYNKEFQEFYLLHLASILVKISDMIRAVDLRYRTNKPGRLDVFQIYKEKIEKAFENLYEYSYEEDSTHTFLNEDICNISEELKKYIGKIDFFITSPPYLNGTNYDRNTKLEMSFLDMLKNDEDLRNLRTKMVTAGINSTHTKNVYNTDISFLNDLINDVKRNAYDRRIPLMVKGYFSDMDLAIQNITKLMKKDAKGVIVIGDSQFGGVHIETDLILAEICKIHNLNIDKIDVVRARRSKNGMQLRESLIFVRK